MSKEDDTLDAEAVDEDAAVAAEGLGVNFRDSSWKQPTAEAAKSHGRSSIYENGKASVCSTGPKQLGGLGEGISLYFYILKYLSVYFFIASIIAVPHLVISFGGNAITDNNIGTASPLVKFSAINHADAALLTKYEDEDNSNKAAMYAVDDDSLTNVKFCKSTYYGFQSYTCEDLKMYVVDGFMTPLTISDPRQEGSDKTVEFTLAVLDCDLGCDCGFDLSEQQTNDLSQFTSNSGDISTCEEYYEEEKEALISNSYDEEPSSPPGLTINGDQYCQGARCGDWALWYGQTWMDNLDEMQDCDCYMALMKCGAYNPSAENLNLAPILNQTITRNDASTLIGLCDVLYSLLFILMWKMMSRKVAVVIRQTDDDNVTAGDYTVCVTGLPTDATEEEIRKHFSDLYDLSKPDWDFKGYLCGLWGKKKPKMPEDCLGYDMMPMVCEPVESVELHGKQNYIGSWVADVNIARPNGKLIRRCQALKKYSVKLLEARAQVKKHSPGTPLKGGSKPGRLKKAETKLKLLEDKIAKIHKNLQGSAKSFAKIDNECMAAFVTFENEDSFIRCLDDFGRYSKRGLNPFTWLIPPQPDKIKFKGHYFLEVDVSPEPSNILWENLETTFFAGLIRKTITATVTITMLLVSLALVIIVKQVKEDVEKAVPDLGKCTAGLPAVFGEGGDEAAGVSYFWQEDFDQYCPEGKVFITVEGFQDIDTDSSAEEVEAFVAEYENTCQDPCIPDTTDKVTCVGYTGNEDNEDTEYSRIRSVGAFEDGSNKGYDYVSFENCPTDDVDACASVDSNFEGWKDLSETNNPDAEFLWDDPSSLACVEDLDPSFDASSENQKNRKNCVQFQRQTMKGCFCLNAMLESIEEFGIMDGAQKLVEDYGDICGTFAKQYLLAQTLVVGSAAMVSVINVFLTTTIKGMATFEQHKSLSAQTKAISSQIAITMFVNTALIIMIVHAAIEFEPLNALGMLSGSAEDFNFNWYMNVGSAIILTMAINSITVHIAPLLAYFIITPVKRCFASASATQRSFNKKFEGPEFAISTRFPMVLNTLSVTLVFSSALPILLPIAFVACQLFYHVDKLLLLRFFKAPPAYDAKLASGTVKLLPFVMIVHLAFAVWVYSNDETFQSECIPNVDDLYEYIQQGSEFDTMNVIPRLLKRNVFPVFLIFLMLIALVVYETFGSWIVRAILNGTLGTVFNVILFPLKKFYKCCCGDKVPIDKEFNPPFTKDFVRGYTKGTKAPNLSSAAGWVLSKDDGGLKVHTKTWITDDEKNGVSRSAGEPKKTWEAIRDSQVHTYNIRHNPAYTDAMIAKDELTAALGIGGGGTRE
ncbi:hypothetical protein TL16_g11773 [Triparma laevis f. inornata]|uniref:CSC1/OSCA1-like cytosolic domain-containing protein n=1 Tax=Triparma laevis f. inornata TaxID=1714386 RepID=A0A9W7BM57_9STRA|nr:hypothetical protein TL16_g11773 [Triparma laevis f. inornata]